MPLSPFWSLGTFLAAPRCKDTGAPLGPRLDVASVTRFGRLGALRPGSFSARSPGSEHTARAPSVAPQPAGPRCPDPSLGLIIRHSDKVTMYHVCFLWCHHISLDLVSF